MPYVQSTALEHVSYDEATHILRAQFRQSGRTYAYYDVPPDVYDSLIFADSLGAFFNAHIRDQFDFEEVENPSRRSRRSASSSSSDAVRSNLS
ncbi:MAG TPA: KTSC domain-containing protein [Rhizomicrobium sp.]|jgi:hypothetical protein|nr:KTSC domain-containing protein [Rhizomicrobium sp.]